MFGLQFLVSGVEHQLAGNLDVAWRDFQAGHRIYVGLGDVVATFCALLWLGEVCFARGELQRAADYYHQALAHENEDLEAFQQQLMSETGEREPFFVSWTCYNLARIAYERNELTAAQQYLVRAQASGQDPEGEIHLLTTGGLIHARLLHRSGETIQAQKLLETWERRARYSWQVRAIRACQARLHLEMGNISAVEQWSRAKFHTFGWSIREVDRDLPYVMQEEEGLLLVRLHLAQEQPQTALEELASWKENAQTQGRTHALLEILILETLAHAALREVSQANTTLMQALRLAQPANYQRLFLDEGQLMATILQSTLKEIQEPELRAHVRRLLDVFTQAQVQAPSFPVPPQVASPLLEPLTPQEQRVLRLLAEGASNQQIANQLVVSLVTVKKHMSNLLGKLGVANRTQAIVRAREYGLL
jgi:LuxR family maltose regulon positive regulatory protein